MRVRFPIVCFLTALAFGAPPELLVVNKEGSMAIVDPASNAVVATVRTGDGPHEVVASPGGKLAFVSNYGSGTAPGNSISEIDLDARREVRRIDLGLLQAPHGLAFAGGKLYFTAERNQVFGIYDPAAGRIEWIQGTGQNTTHMIAVAANLNMVFTSNIGSNSISLFERDGPQTWNQTVIPVGKGPEGFDITPDGKELWTAQSRDGNISVINVFDKRVVRTLRVQTRRSNRLKFTPDGRLVLISDFDGGTLLVLDRTTCKELKRINLGRRPAGILVSPDSSRAYVAVTGDNNVAIVNLRTFDLIARIETGDEPDGMAWAVRP
ncbi:MAG TPA: YncE family protein [Bryobacteraceae bacterium]|nr:YncE family protein [Bryobacteraceae bacterium]